MIKYPDGRIMKKDTKKVSLKIPTSANRGMGLEYDINLSNEFYNQKNIALITKRPTPINIVKVDYSKGARITDAYFEKQSTTDYNGIYKGKYIDFEAKSCQSRTSFPLQNIYEHQFEHLKRVQEQGGLSFFIICFELLNETYVVKAEDIIALKKLNKKKSLSLLEIRNLGKLVVNGFQPRLDYLSAVEKLFF